MFNQALSMNNSKDIIANSIRLVNDNEMKDINDIFLSKLVNYYPKIYILMISLIIIIQKYKQTSFLI